MGPGGVGVSLGPGITTGDISENIELAADLLCIIKRMKSQASRRLGIWWENYMKCTVYKMQHCEGWAGEGAEMTNIG